ncbi:MAG TPA: hypothetical protein VGO47_04695 [Chlamydiales bacterium]|nr:hypothetical protein [Chlamydiales bacterium]
MSLDPALARNSLLVPQAVSRRFNLSCSAAGELEGDLVLLSVGVDLQGQFNYTSLDALEGSQTANVHRNDQERLEIAITNSSNVETGKVRNKPFPLTATMIILTYVGPYNHQFVCELICLLGSLRLACLFPLLANQTVQTFTTAITGGQWQTMAF